MKNIVLTVLIFSVLSCTRKLGKTVYGENRAVKSAYSVSVCTKPSKRYTKATEVAVKASFDSLKGLPSANFDANLKQTIVRLSDYTSEGLDFDLLYFRICEFSNSAGLSEEVKTDIIKKSLEIWQNVALQKNTKGQSSTSVNQSGGINAPITQNNINQQGGIAAGIVVVPEDKEIPLNNNFAITEVTDTIFTNRMPGKLIFEFRPRQGNWYKPYVGYPANEDSLVHGRMMPKTTGGYMMTGAGDGFYDINTQAGSVKMKVLYGSATAPATFARGYLFVCDKAPSILMLGEMESEKNYIVYKNSKK